MKRSIRAFQASLIAALFAATVFAETTREIVDGQYIITVPEGESMWMSENEEATFHDCTALVKKGKGTLVIGSNAKLENYEGTIYIYEGIYESRSINGLGSANAVAYVDGGTFRSAILQGGGTVYSGTVHLKGTGYNDGTRDLGAFCNVRNMPYGGGFANVILDDDTLIMISRDGNDSDTQCTIAKTLDMNNHTLTIRGFGSLGTPDQLNMNVKSFANLGNIVIDGAQISVYSIVMEECTTSFTFMNGGVLGYTNAGENAGLEPDVIKTQIGNINLNLGDGSMIVCNTRTPNFGEWGYLHNTYAGPVTLTGYTTITNTADANYPGSHIQFRGKVSGTGGFEIRGGAKIVFWNTANDFTGDIIVDGIDLTPGTTVNGMASGTAGGEICGVLGSVIGTKDAAIPTNENQKVILKKGYVFFKQSVLPGVVASSESPSVIFADNCTYKLPALTGFATITNGVGTLTGTWSLRPEDIAGSKLLTKLGNTTFSFGEGATLTLTDENTTPVADRQLTSGDISGLDNIKKNFKSTSGKFSLKTRNNNLWLVKKLGLAILVR